MTVLTLRCRMGLLLMFDEYDFRSLTRLRAAVSRCLLTKRAAFQSGWFTDKSPQTCRRDSLGDATSRFLKILVLPDPHNCPSCLSEQPVSLGIALTVLFDFLPPKFFITL